MGSEEDDPIRRRAAEIRAEEQEAVRTEGERDSDLRAERTRFAQDFLDALTEKTTHAVECVAVDERPHGLIARSNFLKDGKAWTQNMFEFGIDRINGKIEARTFLYYLVPGTGAFAIPNPDTGVARELVNSSAAEVIRYAVAISIEMMARVVASGGMLGTAQDLNSAIVEQERAQLARDAAAKRERSRRFWDGCGAAILWFFGIIIGLGILGNVLRACSGT